MGPVGIASAGGFCPPQEVEDKGKPTEEKSLSNEKPDVTADINVDAVGKLFIAHGTSHTQSTIGNCSSLPSLVHGLELSSMYLIL